MNYFITAPIALLYACSSDKYKKQSHYYIVTFKGTDDIRNGKKKDMLNVKIAQALRINYSIVNLQNARKKLNEVTDKSSIVIEQQLISNLLVDSQIKKPLETSILAYASDFLLAYSRIPKWPVSFRSIWYSKKFRDSFRKVNIDNFILPSFPSQFRRFAGKRVITIESESFFASCRKLLSSKQFCELSSNLRLSAQENRIFVNLHDKILSLDETSHLKKLVESIENSTNKFCRIILKVHPACKVSHSELIDFRNNLSELGFYISKLENLSEFPFTPIELLLASDRQNNYYYGPLTGGVIFTNYAQCFFTFPVDKKSKKFTLISYSQFLRRWLSHGFVIHYSKLIK